MKPQRSDTGSDTGADWPTVLAAAIRAARPGLTLYVKNEIRQELARRACARLGREDVKIEVAP